MSLSSITVKNFTLFSEYFLTISVLYILVISILICYNIFGLIIQQSISHCIGLILFFTCYLLFIIRSRQRTKSTNQ